MTAESNKEALRAITRLEVDTKDEIAQALLSTTHFRVGSWVDPIRGS